MTKKQVVYYPSEILRTVCKEATSSDDVAKIGVDLIDSMGDGIGLSAPQIGVLKRVIVIGAEEGEPIVMVNPVLIDLSTSYQTIEVGCVSLPGILRKVKYHKAVVVEFHTTAGERRELGLVGVWAACVQHEIDHLNGKVFIDRLNAWNKLMVSGSISDLPKN